MKPKSKYATYCSVCGLAITTMHIGAMIEAENIVDFNERCFTELSIHICTDCWEKIKQYTLDGMDKAVVKSEKLKQHDAEHAHRHHNASASDRPT
jgi:hypothetical protein